MDGEQKDMWKFISDCTMRGAWYGIFGGACTGGLFALWAFHGASVLVFVIGTIFGAIIGPIVGVVFGCINGIMLRCLESLRPVRLPPSIEERQRIACCVVTSIVLDVVIGVISYWANEVEIIVVCVLAFPAIIVAAMSLGRWVTNKYYLLPAATFTRPFVEESPEVWPPAPRAN